MQLVLPRAIRLKAMQLFKPKFQQDPRWKRDNYRGQHPEEAAIYLGVLALRDMIAEVTREAVSGLGKVRCTPGNDNSIANLKTEVRFKLTAIASELAACETLLRAAENDPRFALAEKEFKPLLEASAARDAAEEKVRLDRQLAEAQLNQARESSWRAALEKAESDPSIQKAAAELAAAEKAVSEL